ncbi:MAG: serine/threonine protein phosphatase [Planctomycetaceae bacterium]|nr:serine/threonine protein phosphatase [Planctomycetaceae bacterium]
MAARTLAIGDIHGCDVALKTVLEKLSPDRDDTLVVLGDVVDRGPGSRQAVDQLLELGRHCQVILILGNHEEMMLNAVSGGEWTRGWLRYGGQATLDSYGGELANVPVEHWEFLKSGRDYWLTERNLFVHANLEPGVPLEKQVPDWLRWTHLTGIEAPLLPGRRIFCGHTPQTLGIPLVLPGWVCIDTFACGTGWLTGLDVETNEYVQAQQSGVHRTGLLSRE